MDELSREANAIPTVRCEQQRRAVFIHDKTTAMGVGAYLFGEGYPSPMFQSGDKSFTNASARKMILHQ